MTPPPNASRPARITLATPLGRFVVGELDGRIVAAGWGEAEDETETPLLRTAAQQLDSYFHGRLRAFDLPLAPAGSAFEQAVWREMCQIPYGATSSYGEVARRLGGGDARAVGAACGRNPIPILIPCHRIVAGSGRTGGYSGRSGIETKNFLLALEGARLL